MIFDKVSDAFNPIGSKPLGEATKRATSPDPLNADTVQQSTDDLPSWTSRQEQVRFY